jgi:hypothetical protein
MMMTDQKKKPPMAKAIREFVSAMQFPPAKNSDANYKSAGLILAMLQHGKGLWDGSAIATCSPSYAQLTDILHCSVPTIKRQMGKLIRLGLVVPQRRGHASNQFTIHQTPVQTDQQVIHHETDQQVIHRNRSPRPARQINKPIQTDHLDVQRDQQVIYSGVMPQGSFQDKPPQESGSVKDDGFVFSGKDPAQLPDPNTGQQSTPSSKNPAPKFPDAQDPFAGFPPCDPGCHWEVNGDEARMVPDAIL